MSDVYTYGGMGKLTITPTPAFSPSGQYVQRQVQDPCNGNTLTNFYFDWTLPYPEIVSGGRTYPAGNGINRYYNCAAANPVFVGWNNMYMAINALMSLASSNHVVVSQLDIQNELNFNEYTAMARLIYDNVAADSSTGPVDVLNQLRIRMSNNTFDSLRVFPSVQEDRSSSALYNCPSVYGDYARLMHLSAAVAAIGGGAIGDPTGWNVINALPCGGTVGSGSTAMIYLPASWAAADIIDIHSYPCVITGVGGGCVSNQGGSTIQGEATTTFGDIQTFLSTWAPTGWRGYNPSMYYALATIGETHTTALNSTGTANCDGNATNSAQYTYAGYVASTLNGHYLSNGSTPGTVLRPWDVYGATCYAIPLIANPPYVPAP